MMYQSRRILLGVATCLTLTSLAVNSLAQPYTPPKDIPKGMSTKQPGDKPGPTVEELKGLPGAPDPDNSKFNPADPAQSYPEGLQGPGKEGDDPAELEDDKGSLPPAVFPQAPKVLALKFERPIAYSVRGTHRLAVEDREDLKQIYQSTARVRYERIKDVSQRPEPLWAVDASGAEALTKDATLVPMLLTVERSLGRYTYPELLAEPERVHQITRAARLSYLISGTGKIEDVQVHEPTSSLARNSIEHFAHMLSLSQPVFPERAVSPGDTWNQKIFYRDGEGQAQLSEDSTNVYTFERWRSCRTGVCAFITVKQDLRAAGRLLVGDQETRGTSVGEGEGWILFDYETGEVVKSFMMIKGLGGVEALQKSDDGGVKSAAKARVVVEYEVTSERIDSEKAAESTLPTKKSP